MEFFFNKVADCDLLKKDVITVSFGRVLWISFQISFFLKYLRENWSIPFRSLWDFISGFLSVEVFLRVYFDGCPCNAKLQQELFRFLNEYSLRMHSPRAVLWNACPKKSLNIIHETSLPTNVCSKNYAINPSSVHLFSSIASVQLTL